MDVGLYLQVGYGYVSWSEVW